MVSQKSCLISVSVACSAASLCVGVWLGSHSLAVAQKDAKPVMAVNPQEKVLYSNLYMQTSAEYYALCEQTYALATEKLRARLLQLPDNDSKKPAVVMDLDETVIDNSGYQSFIDRERTTFIPETWGRWEKDFSNEVGLIPGAKDFITAAERSGVTLVYLSNRAAENKEGTIKALQANGLDTTNIEARLLLQEPKTSSDKTARRNIARERYRVVMLIGDNLRDLSEEFAAPKLKGDDDAGQKKAIIEQRSKVEANRYHFGTDWFVLPNPVYGEWEKLLGDNPRLKLRETKMRVTSPK